MGEFRLREKCRTTAGGFFWPRLARRARSPSATIWGSRRGRKCRGEHRSALRRLIVTQGDTEPASVEQQQRRLGATCPSLYDLRNLYQINVEEGRHLWAMVYLLHAYFGRDGREEAEMMLQRHSGDPDRPRILGAFNEQTPHWLSYFMFTHFTDRDGKYQLASLAESGFDPLARTCQFMLTEEAHHMFVGETGIRRVVERTCDVMAALKTDDAQRVRAAGVIDLPTVQRFLNFHYSVSLDLFGQEQSTNAATYFTAGLKGRFQETRIDDDHRLTGDAWPVHAPRGGRVVCEDRPALLAVNERLRDAFIADSQRGVDRWNRAISEHGVDYRLTLPAPRLQPPDRRVRRRRGVAVRRPSQRRRLGLAGRRLAAVGRRPRIRDVADDAGDGRRASSRVGSRRRRAALTAGPWILTTCALRPDTAGRGEVSCGITPVVVDDATRPSAIAFAPVFNVAVPFIDRHVREGRSAKAAVRTVDGDVSYG